MSRVEVLDKNHYRPKSCRQPSEHVCHRCETACRGRYRDYLKLALAG